MGHKVGSPLRSIRFTRDAIPHPDPQFLVRSGLDMKETMENELFSHPAESEHVATKHDHSSEPVQNPVFSDKQK